MNELKLTSTQIGALAENVVANELMIHSAGQLSPFQPVADDDGIDLLAYNKLNGVAIPIQIKCRTTTLNRSPNVVHFEIRKAAIRAERWMMIICVLMEQDDLTTVRRAWLFPARDLAKISANRENKFVMRPSIKESSKDRYTPYRCSNLEELTKRLARIEQNR